MNVASRDVDGINQLPLSLASGLLVELIRRLKAVARKEQVQMKRVLRVWTVINAVKDIRSGATIMQRGQFWSVEKASGTLEVKGYEVSSPGVAIGKRTIFMGRAEGAVKHIE